MIAIFCSASRNVIRKEESESQMKERNSFHPSDSFIASFADSSFAFELDQPNHIFTCIPSCSHVWIMPPASIDRTEGKTSARMIVVITIPFYPYSTFCSVTHSYNSCFAFPLILADRKQRIPQPGMMCERDTHEISCPLSEFIQLSCCCFVQQNFHRLESIDRTCAYFPVHLLETVSYRRSSAS